MTAVTPGREELLARLHAYILHHYGSAATGSPKQRENFERDLASMVARLAAKPDDEGVRRPRSMAAQWTYDPEAEAYYFAPMQAAPPPYKTQRHVQAIVDIAADGTLAGVELIDNMPPPPTAALSTTGEPKR